MTRRVYVYRLDVAYPPRSHWTLPDFDPRWEPENWIPIQDVDREAGAPEDQPFRWPSRLHYLSRSAAERRAAMLRRWGATVTIERSEAVRWNG